MFGRKTRLVHSPRYRARSPREERELNEKMIARARRDMERVEAIRAQRPGLCPICRQDFAPGAVILPAFLPRRWGHAECVEGFRPYERKSQ